MARVSIVAVLVVVVIVFRSPVSFSRPSSCNYSSQKCGSMDIPYPFGMSSSCGLPDFRIDCKRNSTSGAGLFPFLQIGTIETPELQVLNFSTASLVVDATDFKAMPTVNHCGSVDGTMQFALQNHGPFILAENNFFVVIGCRSRGSCDASASKNFSLSCSTGCYNEFTFPFCSPYACCITALPPGSRYLNFTGNGITYLDFPGVCGYSTILSPETFIQSAHSGDFGKTGHYGLNVSWGILFTAAATNCSTVMSSHDYACSNDATCVDVPDVQGYACRCNVGYVGDGYENGLGCEDIDECSSGDDDCERPPLGRCTNTAGSYNCSCANGVGNGRKGNCTNSAVIGGGSNMAVLVTVGVVAALASLLLVLFIIGMQRARNSSRKKAENFRRNGGELLQHILSSQDSGAERLQALLFTPDELQKATQSFSEANKLGSGAFGTVYRGQLAKPDKVVAIKKAKNLRDEAVGQFINEIVLLGKVDHPNIVRLLGYCLETDVPLLVYEYVDNGTLSERLQNVRDGTHRLSWEMRLLIAVQSAEAIAHLHDLSPPILHHDIKSANILLDQACTPKVADFGASHFLPTGQTHLSVDMLVFTLGYVDPEYYCESILTDRSDVYSFGVVLLELITSLPAFFSGATLVQRYFTTIQGGRLEDLVDRSILSTGVEQVMRSVGQVAHVATRCLAPSRERPSMRMACEDLRKIEASYRLATIDVAERLPEELSRPFIGIEQTNAMPQLGEESEDSSLLISWEGRSHIQWASSDASNLGLGSASASKASSMELMSFSSI